MSDSRFAFLSSLSLSLSFLSAPDQLGLTRPHFSLFSSSLRPGPRGPRRGPEGAGIVADGGRLLDRQQAALQQGSLQPGRGHGPRWLRQVGVQHLRQKVDVPGKGVDAVRQHVGMSEAADGLDRAPARARVPPLLRRRSFRAIAALAIAAAVTQDDPSKQL